MAEYLFVDLESANKEIDDLNRILENERKMLARQVEKNVRESTSYKGQISLLNSKCKEMKELLKKIVDSDAVRNDDEILHDRCVDFLRNAW